MSVDMLQKFFVQFLQLDLIALILCLQLGIRPLPARINNRSHNLQNALAGIITVSIGHSLSRPAGRHADGNEADE